MDRLKERVEIAESALATLDEVLSDKTASLVIRDASIKRFEYSYEAVVKAAQRYVALKEGKQIFGPKPLARACFQAGLLSETEAEAVIEMVNDRNLTVHTYDEEVAGEIASRIPAHARLLRVWLAAIRARI